ncbi:hypothetical protein B1790_10550 [Mycobacterium sp. AT1]|nr:hypothetical protein B1790_10550 [Mycobacterium sp. AT1]
MDWAVMRSRARRPMRLKAGLLSMHIWFLAMPYGCYGLSFGASDLPDSADTGSAVVAEVSVSPALLE